MPSQMSQTSYVQPDEYSIYLRLMSSQMKSKYTSVQYQAR